MTLRLTAVSATKTEAVKARIRAAQAERNVRRGFRHTREAWLQEAISIMRPWFVRAGFPLPERLDVSVSWAYTRGLVDASQIWGQCFPPEVSRDGKTTQIGIAPWADSGERTIKMANGRAVKMSMYYEVLNTLLHEGVHAAVGTKEGHSGKFKEACVKLGYGQDDFVTTPLTDELVARFDAIMVRLGRYPHQAIKVNNLHKAVMGGQIVIADGPKPPAPSNAKNKYEKVACDECGYNARVYSKWINEKGTPICPCNNKPMTRLGTHVKKGKKS